MNANLSQLQPNLWQLSGLVSFNQAEQLATTLPLHNKATPNLEIDLSQAQANSALILVLLAWQRRSQELKLTIKFSQASAKLHSLIRLSHLDSLLPLS